MRFKQTFENCFKDSGLPQKQEYCAMQVTTIISETLSNNRRDLNDKIDTLMEQKNKNYVEPLENFIVQNNLSSEMMPLIEKITSYLEGNPLMQHIKILSDRGYVYFKALSHHCPDLPYEVAGNIVSFLHEYDDYFGDYFEIVQQAESEIDFSSFLE